MKTATLGKVTISYRIEGAGPPLLLIHGFPLDHRMWQAQLDGLADVAQVIAPDLRGFGGSTLAEEDATMDHLADDLIGLLDQLQVQEPVAVCGLSMGGYVAFRLYEKARSRVGRLILCDTRSEADSEDAVAQRRESARRVLDEGAGFLADSMTSRLVAASTQEKRPEVVEAIRGMILSSEPRAVAAALLGMAERPDSSALLAQVDCPTLVVVGEEDQITGVELMQQLADKIPDSQFAIVADAGHMAPMEQPDAVNLVIREFLAVAGRE